MNLDPDTLDRFYEIAGRAAAHHVGARGLPMWMREDLTQEGLLWLLGHPKRIENARLPDRTLFSDRLVAAIRQHYAATGADRPPGEIIGRKYKDSKYTPAQVAEIFPAVFDPEYVPFREASEPGDRFAKMNTSEGMRWESMVADVGRAVDSLGRHSDGVRFLFRHQVLRDTYREMGADEGVSDFTARKRVTDTLEWLTDWLNGIDPNRDKKDEQPRRWDEFDHRRPTSGPDSHYDG